MSKAILEACLVLFGHPIALSTSRCSLCPLLMVIDANNTTGFKTYMSEYSPRHRLFSCVQTFGVSLIIALTPRP